jgi:hypothetical protein
VTRLLFAPVDPRTVLLFRALLAGFCVFAFWPRPGAPAHPAHWALAIGALTLFGAGWRPRLSGLLAIGVLLPLGFLDRGQASRHLLLCALLATSLWNGPGPIWPLRLLQIQLSVVYGVNAVAKSTWHYLSGEALMGMSTLPNFLADFSDGYWHAGGIAVPVMVAAMLSTLVEYFLALAFWFPRLRWLAAAVGVAFHLLLVTIVRIFMLDLATMFLYLAFLLPFADERPVAASSGATPASRGTSSE